MTTWSRLLVGLLGAVELLLAAGTAPASTMVIGVIGGLALVAAPWSASVPLRYGLLLVGTLPYAALTWWSLVSPLLAASALAIGLAALPVPPRRQDLASPPRPGGPRATGSSGPGPGPLPRPPSAVTAGSRASRRGAGWSR